MKIVRVVFRNLVPSHSEIQNSSGRVQGKTSRVHY